MLDAVLAELMAMRPPFAAYEYDIHQMVGERLFQAGMSYIHEAKIGSGCRIDYLVEDVGIEIKKGKPIPKILLGQLERYAACEAVRGLIVITQQSVKLPDAIVGKPVCHLVLSRLWGVALP